MLRHPTILVLFAAAAVGCSADGYQKLASARDSGTTTTAAGTPSGTGSTTPTTNVPTHFELSGDVEVQNELIDPAASVIDIDYRNADGDSVCTDIARPITAATPVVNNDADLPLYGWWSIDLEPSASCPYGPDNLLLGIGAWDPQLDAAAAAQNLVGTDLYALYARLNISDPVWVFGASGTSEQFNGTTPPVTSAPLPDGTYQLRSLFLLPAE